MKRGEALIKALESERAFRETRVTRLRAVLCRRDPLGETVADIEYNDGVRYGLDLALSMIRRERR